MSSGYNPIADYLRRKPDSPLTRGLRLTMKAWRSVNAASEEPCTRTVALDRLLCGGGHGLSAAQYARHTGNFLRASTPIARSPHVQFLEEYQTLGDELFSPAVLRETAYFKYAVESINTVGEFLQGTNEGQIERLAREFAMLLRGQSPQGEYARTHHFRPPGSTVYVRPIKHSDCYEVVDGMHQLAIAHVCGQRTYSVCVLPRAVLTPVQQLVLDSAFCRGNRELYQPVLSPELNGQWTTIRQCSDRFEMMRSFLKEHDLLPANCASYLDLAFSYGWFVQAFGQLGFESYGGGEIDWASCEVGKRVYGLRPEQLSRGELVRFLQDNPRRYDVVSCLSILHHFVVGLPYRGSTSAEELIRLVDHKTKKVLFLDTGQNHELWFRQTLAEWDENHIESWLRENTTFTKIFRLGKDRDNVPPFEDCYGRTLFACVR